MSTTPIGMMGSTPTTRYPTTPYAQVRGADVAKLAHTYPSAAIAARRSGNALPTCFLPHTLPAELSACTAGAGSLVLRLTLC
eukprot:768564-Hanusia_phi.AAC.3